MQITEIVRLVLLFSSFILMGIGVYTDIKERKYPNSILFSTILIGFVYALFSGHIVQSIFGFLLINVFGIAFHKYKLMSAGDMKYLSSVFFYLNIMNFSSSIMFIIYTLLVTSFIGYRFYRKLDYNIPKKLKSELFSYKALIVYRINTFSEHTYSSKEEMLEKSLPFTLPIFLAFILTVITNTVIAV